MLLREIDSLPGLHGDEGDLASPCVSVCWYRDCESLVIGQKVEGKMRERIEGP